MSDQSNRVPPAPKPNTGGTHDTATGKGPQRPDNEPQVAPAEAPPANDEAPGSPGDSKLPTRLFPRTAA